MTEEASRIMVVEDSPEDFEATLRGFRSAGLKNDIIHCEDGDEALDYLHRRGCYGEPGSAPRPAVILLDLNLPGTDGHEVLADIKKDEDLCSIPVVVLTTSNDERDIAACYRAGANSYVRKPVQLESFLEAIRRLKDYWLEIAILPRPD